MPAPEATVIPAKAGIQFVGLISFKINQMHNLDSRPRLRWGQALRGNDGVLFSRNRKIHSL